MAHQTIQLDQFYPPEQLNLYGKSHTLFKQVTGIKKREDLKAARLFQSTLASLERSPSAPYSKSLIREATFAAEQLLTYTTKQPSQVNPLYDHLTHQISAFQYRIGKKKGGIDPLEKPDQQLFEQINKKAVAYKNRLWQLDSRDLSERDRAQLKFLAKYPKFAEHLLKNPRLMLIFFKWTIQNGCSAEAFIYFPDVCRRLNSCFMSKRIGFFRDLMIVKHSNQGKDLTLKFSGTPYSILDENQSVPLKLGYSPTIKKIFDSFQQKNYDTGDFECFQDGIRNFNVEKMAAWDSQKQVYAEVKLDSDSWWENIPTIKTLTSQEIKARYGQQLSPGQFAVVGMGSRETPDLNIINTHGWLEVIVPLKDGRFNLYPFGKFADYFPKNLLENLLILADTRPAKIMTPDMNVFYTHRQKTGKMFSLTEPQFQKLMERIKKDIEKGRRGEIVFQFLADNCASWAQKVLDHTLGKENVPRLYKAHIKKTELTGFLALVSYPIRVIKNKFTRGIYLRILFLFLGAWRSYSVRSIHGHKKTWSVTTSDFWVEGWKSYIPSYIFLCNLKNQS